MQASRSRRRAGLVVEELSSFNSGLDEADRRQKYDKMGADAYSFYRGTAHLFWKDFAGDPRLARFGDRHTRCWLSGDAHVYNFGAFYNDRRQLVYALNDFDEAVIADYQYDLWRLAVSVVLVARGNGKLAAGAQTRVVTALADAYLATMIGYRYNVKERKTVFTEYNTRGRLKKFLRQVAKNNSARKMLAKWTRKSDGARVFDLGNPKLAAVGEATREAVLAAMPLYGETLTGGFCYCARRFRVLDVARRLSAGTGSLGTPRYYVLIRGAGKGSDGNVILDVKGQGKPAGYPYLDQGYRDEYAYLFENDAQRHFAALCSLSNDPDDYAGWMPLPEGWFSVRKRSPYREALPAEQLGTEKRITGVARQWGAILATQHAYADNVYAGGDYLEYEIGRKTADSRDAFCALVAEVALGYADQVGFDYDTFVSEILAGVTPPACT